jgi:formate hydrogenlyase subunit 3/multisubunit Na+/H+ antiporter MnhD subunit
MESAVIGANDCRKGIFWRMIALSIIILPLLLSAFCRWRVASPWVTALLCGGAALPALVVAFGWVSLAPMSFGGLLLEVSFGLDEPRRVLLALAVVLWAVGGVFAAGNLLGQARLASFRFFFLFAMAGNLGLILAEDAASFYTLFALMTFAGYGMVVHTRSEQALRAGRIYLIMAILGELLLISAIYAAVSISGTVTLAAMAESVWQSEHRGIIYGLAIAGFGVKVGMVPLYFWLPLAHPVAPTAASAILSGSMLKAGLLGWLHFAPFSTTGAPEWLLPLAVLGLVAALGAVLIGLCQTDAKTNLAYSSISQMGLLTVFFGLCHAVDAPLEWMLAGLVIYAWNHGISKGALFLGVGVVQATGRRARPWVLLGLGLAALSIAGAPLTGGALTKSLLKDAGSVAPFGLANSLFMLLMLSSFLTMLLLGRFILLCAKKPYVEEEDAGRAWQIGAWLVLLLIMLLGSGWWFRVLLPDVSQALDWGKVVSAGGPIMAGIVLLLLWLFVTRSGESMKKALIPPGDAIVWFERLAGLLLGVWRNQLSPFFARWALDPEKTLYRLLGIEQNAKLADSGERQLGHWNSVGIAFLIVLFAFIFLLGG